MMHYVGGPLDGRDANLSVRDGSNHEVPDLTRKGVHVYRAKGKALRYLRFRKGRVTHLDPEPGVK